MRNTKGQFVKGVKGRLTPEQEQKKNNALKAAWKERDGYHGMYGTKFHNAWRAMRNRCDGNCSKQVNKKYHDKGVGYEKRWYSFHNFYDDMFASYKEGLKLDRIDNSKGYSKGNCRWLNDKESANNKTNNVLIEINGVQKTLSQWSDFYGMKFTNVRNKYYKYYKNGKCTIEEVFKVKKYNPLQLKEAKR